MGKPDVAKLVAARDLIARPGGWMQNAYNADADGYEWVGLGRGVCFCALGAIAEASDFDINRDGDPADNIPAADFFRKAIERDDIAGWNDDDGRKQAEVIAAFDRAIELARAS